MSSQVKHRKDNSDLLMHLPYINYKAKDSIISDLPDEV